MAGNIQLIVCFALLSFTPRVSGIFTPNTADHNAYGLKLAMNEYFFVQVRNDLDPSVFLVRFAPYNNTETAEQCVISSLNTTDHYIYGVTTGKNQQQFFFAGELVNGRNGTFIGVAKYNTSLIPCETRFTFEVKYFYNYEHQEYYTIDVESSGRYAYGFANQFVFIFDALSIQLTVWDGNLTWPHDTFTPHAVDIATNYGVIAGFIHNPVNATAVYLPMIYLINFNASNKRPYVVDHYGPATTLGTWQDLLTNSDANVYSAKYDMSVSIDNGGNVLVGMQFINRVFQLVVNRTNTSRLAYLSRNTMNRALGNGKGVAWLENGIAAVLVNTYSLSYQWSLSQVYFYDILGHVWNSNSTPISVFPNYHQTLPSIFSPVFLNIVSSPSSLALLDDQNNVLVISPTLPGFFPAIEDTGTTPLFTEPQRCLAGSYKNQSGVFDCTLCPAGTKNPGNSSTRCTSCAPGSFCPLGSVDDVPTSMLEPTIQVIAYPRSPENTIFDEVLIQNMFHIGSGHCLLVSPLFWSLIVGGVGILIIIVMGILNNCVNHPRSKIVRHRLKHMFRHTDLIGEGELWVGGLASFAIIVLVIFAYAFSHQYFKQYPIETTSDSHFACDPSLRNAKFDTSLQSLSIPRGAAEKVMFDMLYNQSLYLNVDFINTLVRCDVASLRALFGTQWSTIRWLTCANNNSTLSLTIPLPFQQTSVEILLASTQNIGGLRIGLSADGHHDERYQLKELNFRQPFSKRDQLLAQNLRVSLDITKVINETLAMVGEESDFAGIYIPTFITDASGLFLTQDQYVRSTLSLTILTIIIDETPFYVKNLQAPIAKQAEIIFHNILFTIVCLEIFGLIFLIYKLIFKPLYRLCVSKYFAKDRAKKQPERGESSVLSYAF